jgi:hypothetical protein
MASKYKDKDSGIVLSFNAQWVSWAHTIVAYSMSLGEFLQAAQILSLCLTLSYLV